MDRFEGRVVRILRDDTEGDRHQRFILKLDSGQTLLVAHNIDFAPRVEDLYIGASLSIYGQFESNELGGLIHWTHHDPNGVHEGGWIEFKNKRFE